ncbi:hypothetical protein SAMN05444004_106200 [Jannaschia faecimaris]|uniref:Uncharacterized protein n=2 Tax=Jannaschia faecimaris TaxID=1244108 RepID=A0A1H3QM92_9RHOB|nr:hypothetical protein SAMN05444004_106200 [Jannaschia faecimaris]
MASKARSDTFHQSTQGPKDTAYRMDEDAFPQRETLLKRWTNPEDLQIARHESQEYQRRFFDLMN